LDALIASFLISSCLFRRVDDGRRVAPQEQLHAVDSRDRFDADLHWRRVVARLRDSRIVDPYGALQFNCGA